MPHVSTTIHRCSLPSQNRHCGPRSVDFCGLASCATCRRDATPEFFRTLLALVTKEVELVGTDGLHEFLLFRCQNFASCHRAVALADLRLR